MRYIAAIIAGAMLVVSCAGQRAATTPETSRPKFRPIGLELEKTISGRILAYDLNYPSGVAVDALGNVYLCDTGNHRLIMFDRDLKPIRDFGGYGTGVGKFIRPADITIDHGLNIYVLDTGNRRVVRLDTRLNYIDEIIPEDDPAEIITNRGALSGLHISSLGELTVADFDNSRLIRLDNFQRFSRYIGDFGYGDGALLSPRGIAGGRNDEIYVADAGNSRIAVYDAYGNYLHGFGADTLQRPSAVAVSPDNIIWVADQDLDVIMAFSPEGKVIFQAGEAASDDFNFAEVEAIAVTPEHMLYVADSGHNRVLAYRILFENTEQ